MVSSAVIRATPPRSWVTSFSPQRSTRARTSSTASTEPRPVARRRPYGGTMPLTPEEKATFKRDGVLIRRALVSPALVQRATSLVGSWYRGLKPSDVPAYSQRTFAPELGNHPDILALYEETDAAELATGL